MLIRCTEFENCRKYGIHILEAFHLTLFKRIRQKWSEKDEVSHLYRDAVDEKEKRLYRDW